MRSVFFKIWVNRKDKSDDLQGKSHFARQNVLTVNRKINRTHEVWLSTKLKVLTVNRKINRTHEVWLSMKLKVLTVNRKINRTHEVWLSTKLKVLTSESERWIRFLNTRNYVFIIILMQKTRYLIRKLLWRGYFSYKNKGWFVWMM